MDVTVNFGDGSYIFHSKADVDIAQGIYLDSACLDEFEFELEQNGIDFGYKDN